MKQKPVLIIMAAGMGSRYGGLKQMDPVDEFGNSILHYSVYDAVKAGFSDVIFVIKEENENDFRRFVTDRLKGVCNVTFAFQKTDDVPEGFSVPEGRIKPWGTAHAVRSCRHVLCGRPFVVINADDYYGKTAFQKIFDFLQSAKEGSYAMVGYRLVNTVTENGHVARGVCECSDEGLLTKITERTRIEVHEGGIEYSEDDGNTWNVLKDDTIVSMNFWGFTPGFMEETDKRFNDFCEHLSGEALLKGEYFLPGVVWQLIEENRCTVEVLTTDDKWYGVTYREDKPLVVEALKKKSENKEYDFKEFYGC